MPRKKKEDVQIEDELEKKGKKGGKKGKTPKEPKDDIEMEEISIEEALELLTKDKKNKKNPYKGMDIHKRNLKDETRFICVVNNSTYVVEKVDVDSLRLNTVLGPFAYGLADMDGHILLHSNLNREHAFRVFLHELTHVWVFAHDLTIFDEDEYRFNDESLSQLVANSWLTLEPIVNEFRESAFYHSFAELDI